ncbi:MAG: hypothetical protein A2085_08990 [Gemmatimonadetes bacterium GWC2_71_10]|nr:MAG: hypothetical protein A2085_08990 [Gemmatimonadetes bacterium GWC2_71_10]
MLTSTGTEMAYPLSSTRNRTGSRRLDAELSASQTSPSLVVPSPSDTYTTSSLRALVSRSGMAVMRS